MSWNPKTGIEMFESGCIQCSQCGFKPDDAWDDSPEGFTYTQLVGWVCDECMGTLTEELSRD